MKIIATLLTFCAVLQMQAQPNERFYKGESGKKIKIQGLNVGIETCDGNSQTILNINAANEVESESKKFIGSCSDGRDIQLSDKGVLKFRISQFGDTLTASKYRENGRFSFQKTTTKRTISRFQQKMIPYQNGGYIAAFITYPPVGKTHSVVGFIIYDEKGNEIAQKTVDSLVDAAPNAMLLEGSNATDFYILQGTDTQCGKFKLHKFSRTAKLWTTPLNYDAGCNLMQLQSFAINPQNTRLGLLFVGTSNETFNNYFMLENGTGAPIPTTFDIATRVRYNAKTTFGRNNEVYFARVIDYNTVNSPEADRSALEVLQFDANQILKSRKTYFDNPKPTTDTLPQIEDMLVTNNGTLYVTGSRLRKTWLLAAKDSTSGGTNAPIHSSLSTTIRQVSQAENGQNMVISIDSDANKVVKVEIYNALGQVVKTEDTTLEQGINAVQIDLRNQAQGTYNVKIKSGEIRSNAYTFVKM
jgi:ribosomal protein L21E